MPRFISSPSLHAHFLTRKTPFLTPLSEHEEYTIKTADELANPFAGVEVIKPHPKVPLSLYVGVAGMPGKTAHNAWRTFAKAKKVRLECSLRQNASQVSRPMFRR